MKSAVVIAAMLGASLVSGAAAKIERLSMESEGKKRTYYLFVPETSGPAPLLVLLHGSGRYGLTLAEPWKKLAEKEGIVLAAPDSINSNAWQIPQDGPYFLYELIETLKNRLEIDPRRVYLFGHSGGAIQALHMALIESGYFAAAAVHAGALPQDANGLTTYATRKIPIGMWVGTNDPLFPLNKVRATRDMLKTAGIPAELTEIRGHTHNYYSRSGEINAQVWAFLKQHRLERDPFYTPVAFGAKPGRD